MTALHLSILLHYYYSGKDFEMIDSNETRKAYAYDLVGEGYLFMTKKADTIYEITRRGKDIINEAIGLL